MNIYDFDGTICCKDATVEFWKFCIKKKPIILVCLPLQLFGLLLSRLYITNHISLFYSYLWFFKGDESIIKEFCDKHEKNISAIGI